MAVTFDFASVRQGVHNLDKVMRNFRYEISSFTHGKNNSWPILRIFQPNLANMPSVSRGPHMPIDVALKPRFCRWKRTLDGGRTRQI
jgi:hypothetical protein